MSQNESTPKLSPQAKRLSDKRAAKLAKHKKHVALLPKQGELVQAKIDRPVWADGERISTPYTQTFSRNDWKRFINNLDRAGFEVLEADIISDGKTQITEKAPPKAKA